MRNIFLALGALVFAGLLHAQQKDGKVVYERTMQLQIHIQDDNPMAQMLPKTRTDKFELTSGSMRMKKWRRMNSVEMECK